jgi:cyclase
MTWTRRQFVVTSSLALAGGALRRVPLLGQQPPPATPHFEIVRGSVGLFTARGGTVGWYVTPEVVVVVDSQFPDTARMLLDGLKERTSRSIDALVNTHHHGDHTGGNAVLKPSVKRIVAHARVPDLQKAQAAAMPNPTEQAFPDTTFTDTWEMALGANDKLVATHYGPGHTGGDAVIHFQRDEVVHMGDLMFKERHPFVDRAAGASIRNWIATLEKVTAGHGEGTRYIFGHSKDGLPVTGPKADVLVFRDYFSAVLDHVQKGIAAGRAKDEITKLAALPKFEGYMEAPPRLTLAGVLGVAYDELTQKS